MRPPAKERHTNKQNVDIPTGSDVFVWRAIKHDVFVCIDNIRYNKSVLYVATCSHH